MHSLSEGWDDGLFQVLPGRQGMKIWLGRRCLGQAHRQSVCCFHILHEETTVVMLKAHDEDDFGGIVTLQTSEEVEGLNASSLLV